MRQVLHTHRVGYSTTTTGYLPFRGGLKQSTLGVGPLEFGFSDGIPGSISNARKLYVDHLGGLRQVLRSTVFGKCTSRPSPAHASSECAYRFPLLCCATHHLRIMNHESSSPIARRRGMLTIAEDDEGPALVRLASSSADPLPLVFARTGTIIRLARRCGQLFLPLLLTQSSSSSSYVQLGPSRPMTPDDALPRSSTATSTLFAQNSAIRSPFLLARISHLPSVW